MRNLPLKIFSVAIIAAMITLVFFDLTELKAWQVVAAFMPFLLLTGILAFKSHTHDSTEHTQQISQEHHNLWVPSTIIGGRDIDLIDMILTGIMLAIVLYKLVLN